MNESDIQITIGGFTWYGPFKSGDNECWGLIDAQREALGTRWVIKDYRDGWSHFSGWRLVSGGPFGPAHATKEDAMRWAAGFLREQAAQRAAALESSAAVLRALVGSE